MKELEHGDKIIFRVGDTRYHYRVEDTYLECEGYNNRAVFDALKINLARKLQLATKHYGYFTKDGNWPNFKPRDYAAATNLVKAVHDLCNIHNFKLKEHETA
jgi:hypothetical protein